MDPVGTQSGPSRDPVGTQSGLSRAPILAFLGTAFGPSGSSRDPVGIQSGTNFRIFGTTFGPVGKQPKSPKNVQKHCKNAIFYGPKAVPKNAKIGARLGPDWIPTGSRLDPDWIPTGQKRCPKTLKLVPDWVPTGSRLGPDWVPTGSRLVFFKKTPISLNLSTYFWNFSTLPCTTPPPRRTPPPPVLSQTRATQHIVNISYHLVMTNIAMENPL